MKLAATPKRPYTMGARADRAAETGVRIIEATIKLFGSRVYEAVTLEEIALKAGVTLQTVLRRFGSKESLFSASAEVAHAQVTTHRDQASAADPPGAIVNLIEHYEEGGTPMLLLLRQEDHIPSIRVLTDRGRAFHRSWVKRVFAPQLTKLKGSRRAIRVAQLIAVTDLTMWKLLRLDLGLSPAQVERAMLEIITALEASR